MIFPKAWEWSQDKETGRSVLIVEDAFDGHREIVFDVPCPSPKWEVFPSMELFENKEPLNQRLAVRILGKHLNAS